MSNEDVKELTPAQIEMAMSLIANRDQAMMELERFLGYLRMEHDAPADAWEINDVRKGFTPRQEDAEDERDNGRRGTQPVERVSRRVKS